MVNTVYISDNEDEEIRCQFCGKLLWSPKDKKEERIDFSKWE
jgi:DNA-directed RNA polymerase subunit RPC12/RpoP